MTYLHTAILILLVVLLVGIGEIAYHNWPSQDDAPNHPGEM